MKNKDSKAKVQVIFGIMLFTLVLTAELYMMINYPRMYIVLAALAFVDLLCLYIVIDGVVVLQGLKNSRQEEQYESIFKSQKASYLMQKKYFEEIEDKLNYLEKASKIPTDEIVNAQKGIAKVIISRGHENTEALMSSYEEVMEQISRFQKEVESITEAMQKNYESSLELQKNTESSTEKAMQEKMQDMKVALKDMELRINSAIMQVQGSVAHTSIVQQPIMQAAVATQPAAVPEVQAAEEPVGFGELPEEEPVAEPESTGEAETAAGPETVDKEEAVAEPEAEPIAEAEEILEPEPDAEAASQEPDLSDPNKALDADEIAALFANMEEELTPAAEAEPAPEPEPEAAAAEPTPEPESEPEAAPPMPDLSDPNKALSPDEIAALFANMGA
jgi:microcompartment protein CcmL/EutN